MCRFFTALLLLSALSLSAYAASKFHPITASSINQPQFRPQFAADGNSNTRWASLGCDKPQWLQIDFGKPITLNNLHIKWERAYATEYKLQVSDDAKAWKTLHHRTDGKDEIAVINDLDGYGRFFRVLCIKPGPYPLYSIWEIWSDDKAVADAFKEAELKYAQYKAKIQAEKRKTVSGHLTALGVNEIVFAARQDGPDGHWYANFSYYAQDENRKCYRKMGRLCKFNVATGKVTYLVDDQDGTVRDPAVHYDAKKIIFSWRKSGSDTFHLYEIGVDGAGLKQLTDGIYDDIEPVYLPDGGIMFISARCKRWVNCWLTQVGVLYRCDGDGKNIQQISANTEQDNTPWVLPDGRILYLRWEYVDRSQVDYHHLWTANPDGTGQMVYFGNLHPSGVFIDAKPIPGTDKVLLINSPGHGSKEHQGQVAIVTDKFGPDEKQAMHNISGFGFRDPYPLSEKAFIVAQGNKMVLMDDNGKCVDIYKLGHEHGDARLHEPRPIIKHQRERVIPPRVDLTKDTGTLILNDVYTGRNMKGIKRGDIKNLLVMEVLPKPINFTGGMDPLTYGGSFSMERILGTIPVEDDGSAFMELPANRSLFFIALDDKDQSVKRMQSFLSVMPGENTSCFGCHEERGAAPLNSAQLGRPKALRSAPHKPKPVAGIPDIFDYPRDIQPIFDKHCLKCHDYDKRKGGVIMTGDRGPIFSHSYATLTIRRQIADGRNLAKSNYPPRTLGAVASKLMDKIGGKHHGVKVSEHEEKMIRFWIESAALYPGTYASLGCGSVGGYVENAQVNMDTQWPTHKSFLDAVNKRCLGCHKTQKLPMLFSISDEMRKSFWRLNWQDKELHYSRHLVFNLSRPEKSMLLLAPLSKEAGGLGLCKTSRVKEHAKPANIFKDSTDDDYKAMLRHITAGKEFLETKSVRFDMPHFKPNAGYVREMKRYGILPATFDVDKDPIDVYETDRKYWESLWYHRR